MVTTLLVITIGVFVLQQVVNVFFPSSGGGSNQFFANWFALSGENFRELRVWTILSYGFLHSTQGFFHILGNMLGLFFIGRILEEIIGRERFLGLYLVSIVAGGAVYLLFHFNDPPVFVLAGEDVFIPMVGASAAVISLLTVFCLLRPEQPVTLLLFFILPLTLKPKWILRGTLAITVGGLLFFELQGTTVVAHSAHLGGLAAGFLYVKLVHGRHSVFGSGSGSRPVMELPDWFKRKSKRPVVREISYTVNRTDRDTVQKEVDRILDKINHSGFASLSDAEKRTLDEAKDLLR